jgi:leucyl-tRNA synthetase
MSKSMFNVVNPDLVCDTYGADTLRLYEMFLGPLEQSKPWDTKGIDGVNRFLKKFWRLFYDRDGWIVTDDAPAPAELKALHKLIAKERADIEAFSFNTTISAFMIALNELSALKCSKRGILEPLVILLSPFAPHIAEELWSLTGGTGLVCKQSWPTYDPEKTVDASIELVVQINGKVRAKIQVPADVDKEKALEAAKENEFAKKWLEGKEIVKEIFVPGKLLNIVVKG